MTEMKALRIAYGEALVELGTQNEKIVVLDADLAHATTTCMFADQYPNRFYNVGIAEQNLMGVAAGLSQTGLIPFASTFALFGAGRAYEQVRNTICYPKLNVKIAVTHSGVTVGEDGGSHQSVEDLALMRVVPNMTVLVPCDANEVKKAVAAAAALEGPVYLRIARPPAPVFTEINAPFTVGKANLLRNGKDVTLIATGLMVYQALEAADELAKNGIDAAVVNMHTLKPFDNEMVVKMAAQTGRIITVEEHSVIGGLGSAVAEVLSEKVSGGCRFKRIGLEDCFGQSGTPDELLKIYGLTAENIAKAAKTLMN
jgi:transketolase